MTHMRLLRLAGALLGMTTLAAGCAARAATVPDGPPLAVPSPPPRVFAPIAEQPIEAAPAAVGTPTTEVPSVSSEPAQPPPPPPRAQAPDREPQPAEVQTAPPRELQAASTAQDEETDRQIRRLVALARTQLQMVRYDALSTTGREQYDQARSFSQQAEAALTNRNYVFARTLADKAAQLSGELIAVAGKR